MPPAVAPARPVKVERSIPGIHSVQGIDSSLDDVKIKGESFVAYVGAAVVDATLIRKIVGASELTLVVLDDSPNRRFLRSQLLQEAHEVILDGLRWKLVKVQNDGWAEPVTLTYEPLVVYLLKQLMGPHKVYRDKATRAEFAQTRAFEAHPRPRFISPELHVVQDIARALEGKKAQQEAKEKRGKGIGEGHLDLKVNTHPATKRQADIVDRMLRVAEARKAPTRVMIAMVAALIDESEIGETSSNLLQITPETAASGGGIDVTSPEQSAKGFLTGYYAGGSGAIGYFKANPDAKFYEIAQAVQASGAGLSSAGKANYGQFGQEAAEWVDAYGGGSEVGTVDFERYAFQQAKTESNWHCMVRLATQVHWRCFESAGWVYFLDDPTLMRSHIRMQVTDVAPGIIDTTFDYDIGKDVTEVTVEALAKTWAGPPGSVATVDRHGPADGLYLVSQIESKPSGRRGVVQVTLHKPTEPLPEPAPKRTEGSVSLSGSTSGAPAKVQAMIAQIDAFDQAHTVYLWGGGHGSIAKPTERVDCSGFVSSVVHAGGYLSTPVTSDGFAAAFPSGEGEWVTIYGDSEHVLMKVKYPDGNWRYAETSHSNPGGGPGWVPDSVGEEGKAAHGSNPCHPAGL